MYKYYLLLYLHKSLDNGNGALRLVPSQLGSQLISYMYRLCVHGEIQDGMQARRQGGCVGCACNPPRAKKVCLMGS